MKHFLIILIISQLLLSCSSDSDSISGTYRMIELSQSGCNNNSDNYVLDLKDEECDTVNGIEYCESGTMSFSDNGTVTSTVSLFSPAFGTLFNINGTGTYVTNGNNTTICLPDCSDFIKSGNTLSATANGFGGCSVAFKLEKI